MIRYVLKCRSEHEFEVWFSKGSDFEVQSKKGLIACPNCGDIKISKAIMSPAISTSIKARKPVIGHAEKSDIDPETAKKLAVMAAEIRSEIGKHCEDVGDKFVDEARAIHYGEKDARPIYGKATPKQAADLKGEGVKIAPLPDVLVPKHRKKLN